MTQSPSSTAAYTNHHETDDEDDRGDSHGLVFSPEHNISVSLESLEDFFESPLSPFTIDSSSPLVSPLSLPSDTHLEPSFGLTTPHRGRFTRTQSTALRDQTSVELPAIALLLAAFKRTSFSCKSGLNDVMKMDIGWPTNVQHITHVTFDRFNGFLGLPVEFELEVPRRVPSASANVFGVSAESMQCSYDLIGNSVPTILLLLQERLYDQGGLQAEGIFRINADNGQEEHLRDQLNKGIVPYDVDVHCLAGLIKAWLRELPKGVLDCLTPEQVMQSNTEEQCVELVALLPPTEAALLSWAINLMADVVQEERLNKMNARNIAMVFAPNMTQMSDPLTALMHAVQVMNFLKTLIVKTVRDREEAALNTRRATSCDTPRDGHEHDRTDPELQGTTQSAETQIKHDIEREGCYSKSSKESEIHEEFESACGSEDMFSRYCSTREITDEDEISYDSQGMVSYESSTMDNTDDDNMGGNIASKQRGKKDRDMGASHDLSSYFSKAQYVPFIRSSGGGKPKSKMNKASADTKSLVQCGMWYESRLR